MGERYRLRRKFPYLRMVKIVGILSDMALKHLTPFVRVGGPS